LYLYEILFIIDPRLTDEEVIQLLTRLQESAKELGAEVRGVDNWGKRRLAYEIRKQREGSYAVWELFAEPVMLKEFERQLKLNENVLRFFSARVPTRKRARPTNAQEVIEEVR
jgi:small subunit ribosomal protein S6